MKNKALRKDPYNIVITGVGGQGNVMASRVLANMLVRSGFRVTIGETFGMSQRGGSVMSHIRVSSTAVWSPQIPKGRADLIVAIEPVEALGVLTDYGNPTVKVLVNMRPIYPVGVITGKPNVRCQANQLSLFTDEKETVLKELRELDLMNLTPLEAMRRLGAWKERLEQG